MPSNGRPTLAWNFYSRTPPNVSPKSRLRYQALGAEQTIYPSPVKSSYRKLAFLRFLALDSAKELAEFKDNIRLQVAGWRCTLISIQGVANAMSWALPRYSRQEINAAGDCLIAEDQVIWLQERDRILGTINNWRSSHSFPLQSFKMTLLSRAKSVDDKAIIAQRLKRLSSIEAKLRRFSDMRLTQMQDIGGRRAVVQNIRRLERLVALYEKSRSKNPTKRHEFVKEKNYINEPKHDGYRSIHYVYRYRSSSKKHSVYNGLKIEIQLRTQLQHAWATAVETVAIFTGQALKSGGGAEDWARFFVLMSTAIALREKQPPVPDAPADKEQLITELRQAAQDLNVEELMSGWSFALTRLPPKNVTKATAFLVVLDTSKHTFQTTGFRMEELEKASEAYLAIEKQTASNPNIQGVLVSLNSVHAIRTAYPNYYVDTSAFIRALRFAIR
jgi:Region found in RelA / SpoT proteins